MEYPLTLALREYQRTAIEKVEGAFSRVRSVLLVSPTGSGKGSMGVALAQRAAERGASILWLAHRRELVDDASRRLAGLGLAEHGVILAGASHGHSNARVNVASLQTLLARGERPPADLLIFDEAHHVAAPSYGSIRKAYPEARLLGLTATPERSDGVGLGDAFDEMLVAALPSELTADGYLVKCDVVGPGRRREHLALSPVEAIERFAPERRVIVFCSSIWHARSVAEKAGGLCIEAKLGHAKRAEALAAFSRGDIRVLTNVYCLTEGWDCPEAEVCVIARGCTSTATYLQMVGRVLRPCAGKTSALVVDLCGTVHEHGLPDEDRIYSLSGRPISRVGNTPTILRCPGCWALYKRQEACPRCGATRPPAPPPKVRPAPLIGINTTTPIAVKQAYFDRLRREQQFAGYAFGWVAHRFRARFGHWPHFPKNNGGGADA